MTAPEITFNKQLYHEKLSRHWDDSLLQLNRFVRTHLFFHLGFIFAIVIEMTIFFMFLDDARTLSFIVASFFLTLFSFFVLRLYLQAKKPDTLMEICEGYLKKCKEVISFQEGIVEHHIAVANAAQKFAAILNEKEYDFYPSPSLLKSLTPSLEKFSGFCHWKDIHQLRALLLKIAVEEHIKVVKCEPTNLEVHAALANAYVIQSSLYADPRKHHGYDEERWVSQERFGASMQELFRETAELAIEEFKILNDYAPDDPWVHVQLAYSYHDLQMPEEEIREYEIVLKLRPNDNETLFKLGMLYFQQGKNAQGLRIYEMLKRKHYQKAETLIKFYGSYA